MAKNGQKKKQSACGGPAALSSDEPDDNHDDDNGQANVADQAQMGIPKIQLGLIIAQRVQARGDVRRFDVFSEKRIEQAGQLDGCKRQADREYDGQEGQP